VSSACLSSFPWLEDVNEVFSLFRIRSASHHTQNLSFVSKVFYSPEGQLVSLGGVCLGTSMNNVVECSIVIELLCDAILHGIHSL
jgi:hypothetical protein